MTRASIMKELKQYPSSNMKKYFVGVGVYLTHFWQIFPFYTTWKHQKTSRVNWCGLLLQSSPSLCLRRLVTPLLSDKKHIKLENQKLREKRHFVLRSRDKFDENYIISMTQFLRLYCNSLITFFTKQTSFQKRMNGPLDQKSQKRKYYRFSSIHLLPSL